VPDLADRFRSFAVAAADGGSPLYGRLSAAIADDPEVVEILTAARPEQRQPMLLLAAVHHEVLRDPATPLAAAYRGERPDEDPYPRFAAFCRERAGTLRELCATRRTQTNEPARCAVLLPCLATVAARAGGRPLALIECGASAGLNLSFDRYAYDYGGGLRGGAPGARLRVECALRGAGRPPLDLPAVASRHGLDLDPADPADPDAARWLHACVWPDQPERHARLAAALAVAREHPVRVDRADALDALPGAIAEAPERAHAVVLHSAFASYLSDAQVERLDAAVAEADRPVSHVSIESPREHREAWASRAPGLGFDVRIDGAPVGAAAHHGQALRWDAP
jgi:hypothetical protein